MEARAGLMLGIMVVTATLSSQSRAACRPWLEVRSEKIRAVSVLSEERSLSILDTLSRFEDFVVRITSARGFTPSRPTLMVMFSRDSWNKFIPDANRIGGIFSTGLYENLIVVPEPVNAGGRGAAGRRDAYNPYKSILHEYVHFVMFEDANQYPRWYHEGMAEVLSDVSFNGDNLQYGVIQDYEVDLVRHTPEFSFKDLITAFPPHGSKTSENAMALNYAFAKVLVHFLSFGAPDRQGQVQAYIKLMNAGVDPDDAFKTAFRGDYADLHKELIEYSKQTTFLRGSIPWGSLSGATGVQISPLGCADAMTETGLALLKMRADPARVSKEWFEGAKREIPDSLPPEVGLALAAAKINDLRGADAQFDAVVAGKGDLSLRWRNKIAESLRLRVSTEDATDTDLALQKQRIIDLYRGQALDGQAEAAEAYGHLAFAHYTDSGVSDAGLDAAKRLVELRPKDWYGALIAATGLEQRGDKNGAIYHWGIVRRNGPDTRFRELGTSRINSLSR